MFHAYSSSGRDRGPCLECVDNRRTVDSGSGFRVAGNRFDPGRRGGRRRRRAAAGRGRGPGRRRDVGHDRFGRRVRHRRRTCGSVPTDRIAGSLRGSGGNGDDNGRPTRGSGSAAPGAAVRGERRGDRYADRTHDRRGPGQRNDSRHRNHRGIVGPQPAGPAATDTGHRSRRNLRHGSPRQHVDGRARRPPAPSGRCCCSTGCRPTIWATAAWPG